MVDLAARTDVADVDAAVVLVNSEDDPQRPDARRSPTARPRERLGVRAERILSDLVETSDDAPLDVARHPLEVARGRSGNTDLEPHCPS
jgi:hypothetical protein